MTLPDPRSPREPAPEGAVAAALAGLDGLAERPPAEHVAVFERLHATLGDALATDAVATEPPGRA